MSPSSSFLPVSAEMSGKKGLTRGKRVEREVEKSHRLRAFQIEDTVITFLPLSLHSLQVFKFHGNASCCRDKSNIRAKCTQINNSSKS